MNEWVPIIKQVEKSIVRIVVLRQNQIISEGTGTIIGPSGCVLTAWHVVEICDDYNKENTPFSLFVFTPKGRFQYRLCNKEYAINIPLPQKESYRIGIDFAILQPLSMVKFESYLPPFFPDNNIEIGSSLLLCGYSEETLDIIDYLKLVKAFSENEQYDRLKMEIKLNKGSMKPATYKSGILAHATTFYSDNPMCYYQYLQIDNGVHGGMSGGPIIDSKGRFIAIITQRNIIKYNLKSGDDILKFELPSGNSLGITLSFLKSFLSSNILKQIIS